MDRLRKWGDTFSCSDAHLACSCLSLCTSVFALSVLKILLNDCIPNTTVIYVEKRNSLSAACVGLARAIPSSLGGRTRRTRSVSFGGGLLVSAAISLVLMITSRSKRLGPMSGMVRVR